MSRAEEAELLRRYLPFIEGYFRSRVRNAEDAEDLSQEAASALLRSWPSFEHRSAVTTWLYAICRNTLCAHLRRTGRHPRPRALEEDDAAEPAAVDQLAVELVMESMSPLHRRLYDLYYRMGYSVREISALLGRPEGTVKYELHLLRSTARRRMG